MLLEEPGRVYFAAVHLLQNMAEDGDNLGRLGCVPRLRHILADLFADIVEKGSLRFCNLILKRKRRIRPDKLSAGGGAVLCG